MDFIKKHYEKIILSAVLLGLVGFLVFLPFVISQDKQDMSDMTGKIIPRPDRLPDLDMSQQQDVLERVRLPVQYDFSTTNKLFNPIVWKKNASGVMFPIKNGNEIGAGAAVVTKISPLYLRVTLDSVLTNDLGATYVIGVERQAAANWQMRRHQQHYATKGEKNDAFTLTNIKGDPADPDELDLKLADTGEVAPLSKDKPFQRLDGYSADLHYDLEKRNFPGCRVGSTILFNGDAYNIVAISADAVVLSAQSNQKKTTLRYSP